jgi:hypothetical protein
VEKPSNTKFPRGVAWRLRALAAVYEGATRTEVSEIGGMTLQIIRDWVPKFNLHGPEGRIGRDAPGSTPRLNVFQHPSTHNHSPEYYERAKQSSAGGRKGYICEPHQKLTAPPLEKSR